MISYDSNKSISPNFLIICIIQKNLNFIHKFSTNKRTRCVKQTKHIPIFILEIYLT
jgi:hypothetical protein